MRSPLQPTRRAFLASLSAAPLLARKPWEKSRFWDKNPFPNWTGEQIDELLTKSPWAHEHTLKFELGAPRSRRPEFDYSDVGLPSGGGLPQGIPGTGIPGGQRPRGAPTSYPGGGSSSQGGGRGQTVSTEAFLTVRWSSALPIRQALALEEHGRDLPPDVLESLSAEPDEYVIEVFGLPAIVVHQDAKDMEAELARHAFLGPNSGPRINVDSVTMPPHGAYLAITFRFSRAETLTLDERELLFYASAGPFEIEEKFKLKNMLYAGQLAL